MDINDIIQRIDARTAQAFVTAARHVIDALLLESQRVEQARTPETSDYEHATLSRAAPAGEWLSHEEVADAARQLAEAIAAEKWSDGLLWALKLLGGLGGVL